MKILRTYLLTYFKRFLALFCTKNEKLNKTNFTLYRAAVFFRVLEFRYLVLFKYSHNIFYYRIPFKLFGSLRLYEKQFTARLLYGQTHCVFSFSVSSFVFSFIVTFLSTCAKLIHSSSFLFVSNMFICLQRVAATICDWQWLGFNKIKKYSSDLDLALFGAQIQWHSSQLHHRHNTIVLD